MPQESEPKIIEITRERFGELLKMIFFIKSVPHDVNLHMEGTITEFKISLNGHTCALFNVSGKRFYYAENKDV